MDDPRYGAQVRRQDDATHPVQFPGLKAPASAIGLGCMRIQDLSDSVLRELYVAAREAGIDFFDHAAVYGARPHGCESRFGDALRLTPSQREEITLQTKCGTVADGPYLDFTYEHIVASVEGSLRALHTDYLDILLLIVPTRSSSRTRSRARSMTSLRRARSARSECPTTPHDRSTC